MFRNQRGTTLIEALVTISIAGMVVALGAFGVSRNFLDLSTAGQELLNDLRKARVQANRRGAHYRVALGPQAYRTERMVDPDGNGLWEKSNSSTSTEVALPRNVSLSLPSQDDGTIVEFNSRGMVVGPDGENLDRVVDIVLTDSQNGKTVKIRVWPSGQIQVDRTS